MTTSVSYAVACWKALGTEVQLLVHPESAGAAAAARAAELLAEVDRSCSRFRTDSDLTRVNRHAGAWVEIGDTLHAALAVALTAARTTEGIVDPTLGLVLTGLGYDRDFTEVRNRAPGQDPATVTPPPAVGSWRDVELTPRAVRIPFGRALDLGATGKAFASDLIARTLPAELGVDVMVSIGGDVAVGGTGGHDWQVVVCEVPEQTRTTAGRLEPLGADDELLSLPAGGLTTSSVVWRRWRRGGREMHHLIDPRTGAPARPVWRTASVIAADCATANAASTAAVVLGAEATDWLTGQGLAARLVHTDGRVVHIGGWPAAPGP
jgi:thiamine biosynthesis lipoprotein